MCCYRVVPFDAGCRGMRLVLRRPGLVSRRVSVWCARARERGRRRRRRGFGGPWCCAELKAPPGSCYVSVVGGVRQVANIWSQAAGYRTLGKSWVSLLCLGFGEGLESCSSVWPRLLDAPIDTRDHVQGSFTSIHASDPTNCQGVRRKHSVNTIPPRQKHQDSNLD